MKSLLLEIKGTVDGQKSTDIENKLENNVINEFEANYARITDMGLAEELPQGNFDANDLKRRQKKSKAMNLLLRFKGHKEKILAFMYHFNVPFDNNLSERDIRMTKTKQKISGTFRTLKGAVMFCRARSYISTAKKNGINVFEAISNVIRGQPYCRA